MHFLLLHMHLEIIQCIVRIAYELTQFYANMHFAHAAMYNVTSLCMMALKTTHACRKSSEYSNNSEILLSLTLKFVTILKWVNTSI